MGRLLLTLLLLAAGCGDSSEPGEIEIVTECFADAEASRGCLDAWNSLSSKADPGMKAAMADYERCVETAALPEFSKEGCQAEANALLALLPG